MYLLIEKDESVRSSILNINENIFKNIKSIIKVKLVAA